MNVPECDKVLLRKAKVIECFSFWARQVHASA